MSSVCKLVAVNVDGIEVFIHLVHSIVYLFCYILRLNAVVVD